MQRYRVLAVEDDPGNKMVLSNIFKLSEFTSMEFLRRTAIQFSEIANNGNVDLILMDITLTNSVLHGEPVDGLELNAANPKISD